MHCTLCRAQRKETPQLVHTHTHTHIVYSKTYTNKSIVYSNCIRWTSIDRLVAQSFLVCTCCNRTLFLTNDFRRISNAKTIRLMHLFIIYSFHPVNGYLPPFRPSWWMQCVLAGKPFAVINRSNADFRVSSSLPRNEESKIRFHTHRRSVHPPLSFGIFFSFSRLLHPWPSVDCPSFHRSKARKAVHSIHTIVRLNWWKFIKSHQY